jgi:CDGSH-type Zn-finger protein/uncharacterized Fe-S cluster protein YjdI
MTHLALVANLMSAIGGAPHFERPNFPIAPGYHPADMAVRLAPFDRGTLQHFIHLERPEGSDEPDGEGFVRALDYSRGLHGLRISASAQDYLTVGHLYRSLEAGLKAIAAAIGEARLFPGDPALQVGQEIMPLSGLTPVFDLASACRAIETIVEQGEGAPADHAAGHYQRFIAIRSAYDRQLALDPDFRPSHPAAVNPVMRRPPTPEGRVWISDEAAQAVLDVGNSVYVLMLRMLARAFATTDADEKRRLLVAAVDLMTAVTPLGKELARMRANSADACNAGLSFASVRSLAIGAASETTSLFVERAAELLGAARALPQRPRIARAVEVLEMVRARLAGEAPKAAPRSAPKSAAPATEVAAPQAAPEIVEGRSLTLVFDGKRCIHARFCVTGAPKTFLANVVGPWLHPDETATERLVEIAHACPSGAVRYHRKDGGADETPPPVNLLRLRENGPYAVHADLVVAGSRESLRATLCRCGASNNKPYCDGSHHAASFAATGEPETISLDPLATRDGELVVEPLRNGPLAVSGALEICSGTGRVVQRVTEATLCRCGHSQKKPFCDGSHRAAGFTAPGA